MKRMRGKLTQEEASRRIGFKTNQFYKYEAGLKKIKLCDFINLCQSQKLDIHDIFFRILAIDKNFKTDLEIQKKIFEIWLPISDDAVLLGSSISRIWRLRNLKSKLDLVDLLRIIHIYVGKLKEFLESFGSLEPYKNFISNVWMMDPQIVISKYPEAVFLSSMIYLYPVLNAKTKEEKINILQKKSGMTKHRFDEVFSFLIQNNVILEEDGGFISNKYKMELKRSGNDASLHDLMWNIVLEEAYHRSINKNQKLSRESFKVVPVTTEAKKRIRKEMGECYKNIRDIIDKDDPAGRDEIIYFGQFLFGHEDDSER